MVDRRSAGGVSVVVHVVVGDGCTRCRSRCQESVSKTRGTVDKKKQTGKVMADKNGTDERRGERKVRKEEREEESHERVDEHNRKYRLLAHSCTVTSSECVSRGHFTRAHTQRKSGGYRWEPFNFDLHNCWPFVFS